MCKLLVPCSATLTQMDLNAMVAACYALPVLVSVLTVRFFYVLWHSDQPASRPRTTGLRCLIVLGSGEYVLQSCLACQIPYGQVLNAVAWYIKQYSKV